MNSTQSVELSVLDNGIVCVTLDMPGSGANILSDAMLTQLQSCQDEIRSMQDLKGLILISAKPKIFVAGANLKEIHAALDWPDEKIIEFAHRGRKIYDTFSQLGVPSVAAIHGACVGGGLELALGCHQRVATTDRRTILGLPETNLGLIPGWAGTVRTPRMTGLKTGLQLVVSGRTFPSLEALELGLVDRLVAQREDLIAAAIEMINEASETGCFSEPAKSKTALELSQAEIESIGQQVPAKGFAQEVVKQHILSSCTIPFEDACQKEAEAFAKTWGSEQSHGLLNNFFLGEHNKKNPGPVDASLEPASVTHVGIVGAGTMGRGIAAGFQRSGKPVSIYDVNQDAANEVASQLGGSDKNIHSTNELASMKDCQLVIESIVEDFDAKSQLLSQLDSICGEQTLIASNTSSIPIAELATSLKNPSRFCGIHFCHPQKMKLVEIIRGEATAELAIATAVANVRALRMMPVVVNDGPGFVVNRVLSAMLNQAILEFTSGISIHDIDQAMRDFGFQAGPFEIMDIIGIDTCLYAGQVMGQRGIRCVNDSPIVPRMVKRKRLGRKSGAGFYSYPNPDGDPVLDPSVGELLADYVQSAAPQSNLETDLPDGIDRSVFSILSAMTLEASRILDEQGVGHAKDIDICLIHGLSFPSEKGGLLFWAGRTGIQSIRKRIQQLQSVDARYEAGATLNQMDDDSCFY